MVVGDGLGLILRVVGFQLLDLLPLVCFVLGCLI